MAGEVEQAVAGVFDAANLMAAATQDGFHDRVVFGDAAIQDGEQVVGEVGDIGALVFEIGRANHGGFFTDR